MHVPIDRISGALNSQAPTDNQLEKSAVTAFHHFLIRKWLVAKSCPQFFERKTLLLRHCQLQWDIFLEHS